VRPSLVNTVAVPLAGSQNPATLYIATTQPLRLLVRNTGPNLVFLAHNASDLTANANNGIIAAYQLPAGYADVFVLAPKQGMYAVGFGGGSQVSIAVSEALPIDRLG
jgi:hypothetical protein